MGLRKWCLVLTLSLAANFVSADVLLQNWVDSDGNPTTLCDNPNTISGTKIIQSASDIAPFFPVVGVRYVLPVDFTKCKVLNLNGNASFEFVASEFSTITRLAPSVSVTFENLNGRTIKINRRSGCKDDRWAGLMVNNFDVLPDRFNIVIQATQADTVLHWILGNYFNQNICIGM